VAQLEPVVIRLDGKISLGLIGDVVASGLTDDRVAQTIAEKYKAVKENPSVCVAHHGTVPGLLFVTSLKNMGKFLPSSLR
jgi:protein involved in polysaccharide export with SLBB domain